MTALRVLIVEDNQDLADNLFDFLELKGHVTDMAHDGITGLHLAVVNTYDVILLDLVLPGLDGISLCRKLRQDAGKSTPILILTARGSLEDKILGLESGADDYMVKPCAMSEMETRLRVLVRRAGGGGVPTSLQVGNLVYDTAQCQIRRGSRLIELPPIPRQLLEILMRQSPRVVPRHELEHAIWGDAIPDSDALRAHMHLLRSAIDKPFSQHLLHTIRGSGYRLTDQLENMFPETITSETIT
ncbi:MAG: response regulator transcription factor [Magnetococcus sp. WYHC-3]